MLINIIPGDEFAQFLRFTGNLILKITVKHQDGLHRMLTLTKIYE
jgi:hypothetical protein